MNDIDILMVLNNSLLMDLISQVLVVGNPANTNCMMAKMNAPSIPSENFTCLTRLDMNRARAQVNEIEKSVRE